MLGIVTVKRLNIRAKPNKNSRVRGVLPKGGAVSITGQFENWVEFRYDDSPAYLYKNYVSIQEHDKGTLGIVKADLLNVRADPNIRASILGKLPRASELDIVALMPEWAEIRFNDSLGYVSRDYIELQRSQELTDAKVIANMLNIRSQPKKRSTVIGQLPKNTKVKVQGIVEGWLQIAFNSGKGYVHSDYIETLEYSDEPSILGPVDLDDDDDDAAPIHLASEHDIQQLAPIRQLPLGRDQTTNKVALTWNKYGELLRNMCLEKGIEVASAIAVLCVESSGQGFQDSNGGRMIIRFENHKFWRYWGKQNQAEFKNHFVYKSGEAWKGHKWRSDTAESWEAFHGNQKKEWKVLEFARSIDNQAALKSISMGAPQIMGFHYERIGYSSVDEMFSAFEKGIDAHIEGLFDFFDGRMTASLQRLDFEDFSGRYNGSGQKVKYGRWIKNHYEAFKNIALIHSLDI